MGGPETAAGESDVLDGQMGQVFQKEKRYPRIVGAVDVPFAHCSIVDLLVAVYFSKTSDGHILRILGIDKIVDRLSSILAVYIGRHMNAGVQIFLRREGGVIVLVLTGFQHRAVFQMEFYKGF